MAWKYSRASQRPGMRNDLGAHEHNRAGRSADSIYQAASGRLNTNGNGARLKEREREYILRVLAETRTLDEAAMILGINVTTLWRKRKRWGIK